MSTKKLQRITASERSSGPIADQSGQDLSGNTILTPPDPQVKPKRHYAQRRSFDAAYKTRILTAYDACGDAAARGALLRREGLYYARVSAWRQQQAHGKTNAAKGQKNAVRIDHLIRENEQLKKKMAQVEAIVELQKKVSDLLGMQILSLENSVVKS
jgi:hypothetical protein